MKSFLGNFYRHLAIFYGHTVADGRAAATAAAAAASFRMYFAISRPKAFLLLVLELLLAQR